MMVPAELHSQETFCNKAVWTAAKLSLAVLTAIDGRLQKMNAQPCLLPVAFLCKSTQPSSKWKKRKKAHLSVARNTLPVEIAVATVACPDAFTSRTSRRLFRKDELYKRKYDCNVRVRECRRGDPIYGCMFCCNTHVSKHHCIRNGCRAQQHCQKNAHLLHVCYTLGTCDGVQLWIALDRIKPRQHTDEHPNRSRDFLYSAFISPRTLPFSSEPRGFTPRWGVLSCVGRRLLTVPQTGIFMRNSRRKESVARLCVPWNGSEEDGNRGVGFFFFMELHALFHMFYDYVSIANNHTEAQQIHV